jgi:hypothetical protein
VARAAIQFDVFLGFDGIVPEGSWFPVVCEIKNDGPSFTGYIELNGGDYNKGQTRQIKVELPTGTLKRLVIPVFSTTRGYSTWDVQLFDERGKVRAEQTGLRARRQLAKEVPLMGALTRTAGGTPMIRSVMSTQTEAQPAAARLLPQIFPDNPLVLEGMNSLYLNSEIAPELTANQVNALVRWLHAGGHLVVGVEQITDVNSTRWLKELFPCELKDMRGLSSHPELQEWLKRNTWPTNFHYSARSPYNLPGRRAPPPTMAAASSPFTDLPDDFNFETNQLQVATGEVLDGQVEVASGDTPLIVSANRGRGRITVLMFSPEREPVRSWKNLQTLWARLAEIPGAWYVSADFNPMGGWSSDGIFGAMIDTRQVHKLPIAWLLFLLLIYLVVIGPLDQFWLKRIGKPMLTWITFPCYVVIFSLVIYFIGYKLRAGETEWNELHLVDVLANGDHAELRGRTYSSVYSPANQRYLLEAREKYATLRGEFVGGWGGGAQSSEKATVIQDGDSFKAEIFVPVWTSQLFVNDWWQPSAMPLNVTISPQTDGWDVKVENLLDQSATNMQMAVEGSLYLLGSVPSKETKTFKITKGQGTPIESFVQQYGAGFQGVVQSRRQAFGSAESGRIDDLQDSTIAVSFLSKLPMGNQGMYGNSFLSSPGLDVSSALEHGNAVLFAWTGDFSPVPPLYQFTPRRSHKDTMWRIAVPVP